MLLAEMRSGLPSALTSAAVTETGWLPALKGVGPVKLGVAAPAGVVLSSTVLPPAPLVVTLAVMRSGLPSALTSAAATEKGPLPALKGVGPVKLGVAAPVGVVLMSTVLPPAPLVLKLAVMR